MTMNPRSEFEESVLQNPQGSVRSIPLDDVLRSILRSPETDGNPMPSPTPCGRISYDGDFYLPTSQMWQRGSTVVTANSTGSIDPCLKIIAANTVLKKDGRNCWRKRKRMRRRVPPYRRTFDACRAERQ